MTTLLIDSDIVAFKASAATEGVFYFDGPDSEPCVDENLEQGLKIADGLIEEYATKLKATRVVVCLTHEDNFRKDVYPAYKANRKGTRKPSTLKAIKDHFAATHECYVRPGLEADDCMGILATHKTLIKGTRIIVSEDKDMATVPGLLFNPRKDKEPRLVSEVEANRYFFQQVITGDPTDGYPGCPGVGPKSKFVGALQECSTAGEMWNTVLDAYVSKGLDADAAVVQARCARILRACDWDFQEKRVRLWSPPV